MVDLFPHAEGGLRYHAERKKAINMTWNRQYGGNKYYFRNANRQGAECQAACKIKRH